MNVVWEKSYGRLFAVNVDADRSRKDECLCLTGCARHGVCATAHKLYAIALEDKVKFPVTACARYLSPERPTARPEENKPERRGLA